MTRSVHGGSFRPPPALRGLAVSAASCLVLTSCSGLEPWFSFSSESPEPDVAVYERAEQNRVEYLAREVQRLRADLRQAEESMVAIESGLRGVHTRADAVSALAESRITVERAARSAPWRPEQIREAREKLEEAEEQFQAGHSGSAIFFASRARRIAETLNEEASQVEHSSSARFVHGRRVNLRAGPSTSDEVLEVLDDATPVFTERRERGWTMVRTLAGHVGWIHDSLLRSDR